MRIPTGALRLGLGTMRLEGAETIALLHRALDSGIRLFDTADVYGPDPALKNGVVEFCAEKGIALLAHSPLDERASRARDRRCVLPARGGPRCLLVP